MPYNSDHINKLLAPVTFSLEITTNKRNVSLESALTINMPVINDSVIQIHLILHLDFVAPLIPVYVVARETIMY